MIYDEEPSVRETALDVLDILICNKKYLIDEKVKELENIKKLKAEER